MYWAIYSYLLHLHHLLILRCKQSNNLTETVGLGLVALQSHMALSILISVIQRCKQLSGWIKDPKQSSTPTNYVYYNKLIIRQHENYSLKLQLNNLNVYSIFYFLFIICDQIPIAQINSDGKFLF